MSRIRDKDIARFNELQNFDRQFYPDESLLLAGVDEAGRGCLAGPVAAAAVILPFDAFVPGVDDSKVISEKKRFHLAGQIKNQALAWSVSIVSNEYIDRFNILNASKAAMSAAVKSLTHKPGLVLIDALHLDDIDIEQRSLIKGDANSLAIACASILAKTERDLIMASYDRLFPDFGFSRHKGYGTRQHMDALRTAGGCSIHRRTFEPLKSWMDGGDDM